MESLDNYLFYGVTPHAGVWIETNGQREIEECFSVTPHAGVWIETKQLDIQTQIQESLPTRECGLKLDLSINVLVDPCVTPHAGVWIET